MPSVRNAMRYLFPLLLGLACAAPLESALGATVVVVGTGSMVEGSGAMIDDTRAVSGYTRIVVSVPVDVQLKHTGAEKVVVRADDNIASMIETRVEGGRLYIETKKDASFRTRSAVSVQVEFKQLDSLRVDGSGDVLADEVKAGIFEGMIHGSGSVRIGKLEAETVAVSVAGSGTFNARGRADKVGFVIDGSGDVLAQDLQAKSAAVRIAGSGDAHVYATETLQARIAGSGDVRYRGSPQVEKKVVGSGEVKPLN